MAKDFDIFEHYETNIHNEQLILASLMKSKPMRNRILSQVQPVEFVGKRHREIFRTLLKMEQEGLDFNEDTFRQMAGDLNVGPPKYLRKLLQAFEKNANIDFHIEQLKTDRLKFVLFSGPVIELVEALSRKGSQRSELLRLSNLIIDEVRKKTEAERIQAGEEIGNMYIEDFGDRMLTSFVGTGMNELDDRLTDGFSPGTISVISGRPTMGKTVFMANVISHLMRTKKMLLCEIESGSITLIDMLISLHTGIAIERLVKYPHKLKDGDKKRVKHKVRQLLASPNLAFLDDPSLTLDRLEVELKNRRYDICFIDLFGRLKDVRPTVEGFTTKLYQVKRIARETETHLSLVHQMKRKRDQVKKERPTLEKLKDSGTWEEVGDLIFGIHREKYYNPQLRRDVAEVSVLKQKRGESNFMVPFMFDGSICEFGEFVKDYVFGRDLKEF